MNSLLQFQPPGFGPRTIVTSLGAMTYYTQTGAPWPRDGQRSPLLFLHSFGGGASAYEWSQVYSALAMDYEIIAPDLIGWGASSRPERCYSPADYEGMILALIAAVTTEPIAIAASSITGALAVRVANQAPAQVRSLFLVCPSGFRDFAEASPRRLPVEVINLPGLDQVLYTLGATTEWAVRNALENFLFADRDRITPEMVAAYLTAATQPRAAVAALAFLRGDLYFDLAADIPALTVPTTFVWGARSRFSPVAIGRRLAALNPGAIAALHTIPKTGVLPHLEQPSLVAALLRSWLTA
ncbi:alpha/beta fold hydrolase [Spirulina major]|uniref:alpha/beta fold hydrolase n=1 Tax=Spirulina major TaxID=270636 RepID=UPI000934D525|nr:alpha/beta hydrolase [Spirulina major]